MAGDVRNPNSLNSGKLGCPRCGYDQRGVVATWMDACPLSSACSECGLELHWGEVISPDKCEPRWCVEFATQIRALPTACVKTLGFSFWPWRFWLRLRMAHAIHLRRLAIYVLFLLLPLILLYVAAQSAVAIRVWLNWRQSIADHNANVIARSILIWGPPQIEKLQRAREIQRQPSHEKERLILEFEGGGVDSDFRELITLPTQEIDARIRQVERAIAAEKLNPQPTLVLQHTWLAAVGESILFPFATKSVGAIVSTDGTIGEYPAPSKIHRMVTRWWWPSRGTAMAVQQYPRALASGFLLLILLPLSFALLPASCKKAKVRWAHIWRVAIYGLFIVQLTFLVTFAAAVWIYFSARPEAAFALRSTPLVMWIALPIWWAVAIKRHMKMPHGAAIAVLMTLIIALLTLPLLEYALPRWMVLLIPL